MSRASFSTKAPKLQLVWDSVSRGAMEQCPRYYEYKIIEGYQIKKIEGFSMAVDLIFGIWFHSARELYYKARANGAGYEEALDAALDYVLTVTWNRELKRPWMSGDSNKNRKTLVRSVVWYLEKFKDDALETIQLGNGPAIELALREPLGFKGELTGEEFEITAHLDRVVKFNNLIFPTDLKSTKQQLGTWYFAQYTPNDQMSGYAWIAQRALKTQTNGIIIDAAQVLTEGTRFQRATVGRTQAQLEEWHKGVTVMLRQAESYVREDFWPQNTNGCFRCEYRSVCSRPPSTRQRWLDEEFIKKPWDSLAQRGDV